MTIAKALAGQIVTYRGYDGHTYRALVLDVGLGVARLQYRRPAVRETVTELVEDAARITVDTPAHTR